MEEKTLHKARGIRVILAFASLVILTLGLSFVSSKIWGGKPETLPAGLTLAFEDGMTVAEFGRKNNLPNPLLKKVFGLETREDLQKKLTVFPLSPKEIASRVKKAAALSEEYESKNWVKIPVKFGLWIAFLGTVFALMRKGRIVPKVRKGLYLTAVLVFGVVFGSDPSPMGTVKDAIALLGAKGVVFPPRMIALTIFLIMTFVANKFICSWGCQLGTFQDLIFRLNRGLNDTKGIFKQYRPSFLVTNTIRVAFFLVFTLIAFVWATDIVEPIDPFKVFKPTMIGIGGGVFLGLLLLGSLFIYRPWCHLLCPFGLVGWLVEKVSLFNIQVNYDTCIACESCAKACPSTVMGAILKQDRVIPDCFACATCIQVCPTDSIHFYASRRARPPADKFKDKRTDEQKGSETPWRAEKGGPPARRK